MEDQAVAVSLVEAATMALLPIVVQAGVTVVAVIRLLLLTGYRKGEILNLSWSEVALEANELRFRDSKTGPRTISLSPEAAGVLAAIPRVDGNPFVIPGRSRARRCAT